MNNLNKIVRIRFLNIVYKQILKYINTKINELRNIVENNSLDQTMYAKQLFIRDLEYANQSMARITDNLFFAGFNTYANDQNPLLMIIATSTDEDDKTMSTEIKYQTTDFDFGHTSSMAWGRSNNIGYVIDGEIHSTNGVQTVTTNNIIYRVELQQTSNNYSLTRLEPIILPNDVYAYCLMDYENDIYVYGRINSNLCIWQLNTDNGTNVPSQQNVVKKVICNLSGTPKDMPRTEQDWSTDGKYIYHCYSNPNSVAMYNFKTGKFIKLVNIGDFINGNSMIGEIEKICPLSDGTLYLSSQYYYPNTNYHNYRFWCVSKVEFASKMASAQIHQYPNYTREIYVADMASFTINRNNSDSTITTIQKTYQTNGRYQDGTENYPFYSLESAIYAAMTTGNINNRITVVDTGKVYTINELVLRIPAASLSIICNGHVTFKDIHCTSGTLTIDDATVTAIATTARTNLSLINCKFDAVYANEETSITPYRIKGIINIANGQYTGNCKNENSNQVFEFDAGAMGTVGFVQGSTCILNGEAVEIFPASNSFYQFNLRLYNVLNNGNKSQWTNIYRVSEDDANIPIGQILPISNNYAILDNATYRIKWQLNDIIYNTLVNVNGDTYTQLSATTGTDTLNMKVMHVHFNPNNSSITLSGATEYRINNDETTGQPVFQIIEHTAESLYESQWKIISIDVKG